VTATASQPKKSKSPEANQKEVAIIGGGIAGLTCALRLLERGYKVTLYEKDAVLGGQLSSVQHRARGLYHDVYTHLFCDWYANFWRVTADLGIDREANFDPRLGVKILLDPERDQRHPKDDKPRYVELKNPNRAKNIWDNLTSGALPAPDMFLVGYTFLDLVSQPFNKSILEQQSLNGFLYSRPYAIEDCADLHNTILTEIWCSSSSDTAAAAYKDFIRHSLGSSGLPFAWLLRGSLQQRLMGPWRTKLDKFPNCEIKISTAITAVEIEDKEIKLSFEKGKPATHSDVVLAVPATELAKLVMNGSVGRRIVDRIPELSQLQRMRAANVLVVTVVFKTRLPDIPREHVGLAGSLGYLTYIDISQLWDDLIDEPHTVLVLAASDSNFYPSRPDGDWAHMMLKELARYLPSVKPGSTWGDPESNIDYDKSLPQNNRQHPLFLNDMNSEHLLVEPYYPEKLRNVFFAGDFCRNDVNMATVESAVLSGLHAAQELVRKTGGRPDVTVVPCSLPSPAQFAAAKVALLPLAYGALAWSAARAGLRDLASGQVNPFEEGISPVTTLTLIPLRYLSDLVVSLENLADALCSRNEPGGSDWLVQQAWGAVAQRLKAAGDHLRDSGREGSSDKQRTFALIADLLGAIGSGIAQPRAAPAGNVRQKPIAEGTSGLLRGSGRYQASHQYARRHRAKR
jgi:flavin-dependent amine oxidoreductase